MAIPEYRATERAWHLIAEAQYRLPKHARMFLQTFNPDHHLFRSLKEPDRWYRMELSTRKTLGYPPYTFLTRALIGKPLEVDAAREAAERAKAVQAILTETKKPIILHPPIETHPKRLRGAYVQALIARLRSDRWQEDLPWLNAQFPDDWKIDPNPLSLLAP
jgi:primosomal protein N' (replication factor Y)